jgi:prepilin-type N-terminal cleavage/methylation domain-containing protein
LEFKMRPLKAFTLIELLIVVAIIAILAAIAVPNFLEAQTRAKVSRSRADMRSAVTALEAYAVDHNKYPASADVGVPFPTGTNSASFHSRMPSYVTTPIAYITSLTEDPFITKTSGTAVTVSSAVYPLPNRIGHRYVYYNTALQVIPTDFWMGLETWVGPWLIYGYGPDEDWRNGPGGNDTLLPYDPTNGTTSAGNLIRTAKITDGIPLHPTSGDYIWP